MTDLTDETPMANLCELISRHPDSIRHAAITAAETFAWYAMPDLVRSRAVRTVLKTGILVDLVRRSLPAHWFGGAGEVDPWADSDTSDPWAGSDQGEAASAGTPGEVLRTVTENPAGALPPLTLVGGVAALGIAASVAAEKCLFRKGEARRARGNAVGHTVVALPLAALTFAADLTADIVLAQVDQGAK
ncbi:hypothetical protein I6B53_10885 [Schaalia sp. 19OD2882]|uniref:hypothetical protein n=1 Tax=Schaalia sp. 19OD2882 TaxID=2794089 RepID=UPI001C1ED9EA|nr:hypothetical protein [Schaalia sp. 19OD2882]QWW19557.1 hypothetical protein I6B53_10885 [Schaalia sp. 19OD2882]